MNCEYIQLTEDIKSDSNVEYRQEVSSFITSDCLLLFRSSIVITSKSDSIGTGDLRGLSRD